MTDREYGGLKARLAPGNSVQWDGKRLFNHYDFLDRGGGTIRTRWPAEHT